MLKQVATRVSIDVNELDSDARRIVLRNGTLELRPARQDDPHGAEGAFVQHFEARHDPAHLCSRRVEASFDPDAGCPDWHSFLETVQPDVERRLYLQTWAGLNLLGVMDHQALVVHYGRGANGKSTYATALAAIFGGYGATVKSESLLSRN